MEYLLMQPPFEIKSFNEMTKKEAQSHFHWHVSQIPTRMELLQSAYSAISENDREDLDYSSESLIKLWQWYISNAEVEEKSEVAKNLERDQHPD